MNREQLLEQRSERDQFFAEHYASPIPEEDLPGFTGLAYFEPDPSWEISGRYEPTEPRKIPVPSTTGMESPYTMLGAVTLRIGDTPYRLTVLDDGDGGAFIPFRDDTSGSDSYGGGRYVGVDPAEDGTVLIDFNTAKNPWCVYDEEFVCPLPPPGNWIAEPIEAGEMMYHPPEG